MTFNVVLYVTTSHMDYEYLENVKYQYTEKNLNILTCIFHVGKFYVKLLDYGIFVTYNMYMTIDKHTGNYNLQFFYGDRLPVLRYIVIIPIQNSVCHIHVFH